MPLAYRLIASRMVSARLLVAAWQTLGALHTKSWQHSATRHSQKPNVTRAKLTVGGSRQAIVKLEAHTENSDAKPPLVVWGKGKNKRKIKIREKPVALSSEVPSSRVVKGLARLTQDGTVTEANSDFSVPANPKVDEPSDSNPPLPRDKGRTVE